MPKNKYYAIFTLFCAFLLACTACDTGGSFNPDKNAGPPVKVYVAGSYEEGSTDYACYWVNGERITLPVPEGSKNARGTNILVSGGMVFATGMYDEIEEENYDIRSCYWLDEERTDMENYTEIICAAALNDDFYMGGYYKTDDYTIPPKACYWIAGDTDPIEMLPIGLYDGGIYLGSQLEAITVTDNGSVYAAGLFSYDITEPVYESHYYFYYKKDDSPAILMDTPEGIDLWELKISGIAVTDDGTVYVSGCVYSEACYWENGEIHYLQPPPLDTGFSTSSITVSGNKVYIAGAYDDFFGDTKTSRACYWEDGIYKTLSQTGVPMCETEAITVHNGSVYVAGYFMLITQQGVSVKSCYWKNGTLNDAGSVSDTRGFYITVGE